MGMAIISPSRLLGAWEKYRDGRIGVEEAKEIIEGNHGDESTVGSGVSGDDDDRDRDHEDHDDDG